MDNIKQIIQERLKILPEEIRQAIASAKWTEDVSSIAKKYRLHIDQEDALATETMLVLIGLARPEDYITNVSKNLSLPRETASEIEKEIADRIFFNIRESLKKIYTESPEEEKNLSEEEHNLSQEDVLKGIENPQPTSSKVTYKGENLPQQTAVIKPVQNPASSNQKSPMPTTQPQKTVMEKKLTEPVQMDKSEINVPPPVTTSEKKSYKIDPYREPPIG